MTAWLDYALVAVGGAIGAPLRYLTDRAAWRRYDSPFPLGTFISNATGSAVLGLLAGAALGVAGAGPPVSAQLWLLLGVGLCGALTTFSTLAYETARLFEQRARLLAVLNVAGSVVAGLAAVAAGLALGSALA